MSISSSTITFSEIQDLRKQLLELKLNGPKERCGLIGPTGEISETKNLAADPENRFDFDLDQLSQAAGTWHSHPSGSANLSIPDYWFFKSCCSMVHFIVSNDKVKCYIHDNDDLLSIDEEDDLPARIAC